MTTSDQNEAGGAAGRTALVTGASAGIGKATVERLLEEGYHVYAAARRVDRMRDLEELGAVALEMDVTREEDVVAGVERIDGERGGVDILVNNAGFGLYGAVEDIPLDDARYQFEVNLFGAARLTQLVLPRMRERGAGRIVNVSSVGGKIYTPLGSWYYATKHALEGWSDALRWELKHFGIDVIIVEPGLIRTEFGDVMRGPMVGLLGRLGLSRHRREADGQDAEPRPRVAAVGHRRHGPQGGPGQAAQDAIRRRPVREAGTAAPQPDQRPDVRPAHGSDGRPETVSAGASGSGSMRRPSSGSHGRAAGTGPRSHPRR